MQPKETLYFRSFRMKKILSLISLLTICSSFVQFQPAHAADAEVDRLEITAPATAKVGEPVDLTVKAVSKAGELVSSYAGTIFVIVENDNKATVPYAEGYTFTAADQGQKTFSKGLSFTKEGTFKVTVSDFDKMRIEGSTKVKVTAGEVSGPAGNELVTITSPDDNSVLGSASFSVVGTTKKNSRVQLFINGAKALESQTDEKGGFLFEVKGTDQTKNVISVKVLDGTDKVVGESAKITVTAGSSGPEFKSVKLSQKEVLTGSKVTVTVEATPALKSVVATAGEALVTLKEGMVPGTYTGDIVAPNQAGTYPVDVSLKSDLGKETTKTGAETLTVTALKVAYKNIKTEESTGKITFTFEVENEPKEIEKFQFIYSTGGTTNPAFTLPPLLLPGASGSGTAGSGATDGVSGSGSSTGAVSTDMKVVTYEKAKIKNGSGAYVWYIPGLVPMNKYTFTIAGLDANGQVIPGTTSDPIEVDFGLSAAGKCMINDVGGMNVKVESGVSILSWDSIPEAVRYNVYKKNSEGKFVFIESVTSNSYTIHISSGPVKYEDFAVKAVCSDSTESTNLSPSTRVQTGPGQILLFMSIALLVAFGLSRRRFVK